MITIAAPGGGGERALTPGPRKPLARPGKPLAGNREPLAGPPLRAPGKRLLGGFSVRRAGGEGHRGGVGLAGLVRPADADLVAGVVLREHRPDARGGRDGVTGDRGDLVARGQAGLVGCRSRHDPGDGDTAARRAAAEAAEPTIAAGTTEATIADAAGVSAADATDVATVAAEATE